MKLIFEIYNYNKSLIRVHGKALRMGRHVQTEVVSQAG